MPRVLFTEDAQIENAAGQVVEKYLAGSVHDLPMDKCRRWMRRNKAEMFQPAPEAPAAEPVPLSEGPEAGGPSLASGPEKPSSVSPAGPASVTMISTSSDAPTRTEGAESLPSTEAGKDSATPMPSTAQTRRGGGRRTTRKGSKA